MVSGSCSPGSLTRSPPAEATADKLRRLNSTLRDRLANANSDLQAAASSRDVAVDHQHRLSRTLLRQTHGLRALERRYGAQQEEVGRLRAEIESLQWSEDSSVATGPERRQLGVPTSATSTDLHDLESRLDQAISERDTLQDQSDHRAEEVRLAGVKIELLQEEQNHLNRERENAEHELLLTETSLA
ncbi:hypothetical protein PF003_g28297 [Phytophthora fragariae]|nr:hypothetical protein PF003_g28297 [Phytophthora fragariae]